MRSHIPYGLFKCLTIFTAQVHHHFHIEFVHVSDQHTEIHIGHFVLVIVNINKRVFRPC